MISKFLKIFQLLLLCYALFYSANCDYTCQTPDKWLEQGDISNYYKEETANKNGGLKWPDAIIKYHLNSSLSEEDQVQVDLAMQEIENKTCLRFEPYDGNTDNDYVSIETDETVCGKAHVCRQRGYQFAKFGKNCRKANTMIHQLGHTVGLSHETNRYPEDRFIPPDKPCGRKSYGDPVDRIYNLGSQMHVGCHSETKCGHQITSGLSSLDVDYINSVYNCQGCYRHRWIPIEGAKPSDYANLPNFDFFDLSETPLYACRAFFRGDVTVGKFRVEESSCYIGHNGLEYKLCEGFEFFTIPGGKQAADSEYSLIGARNKMPIEEQEETIFKHAIVSGQRSFADGTGLGNGYLVFGVLKNLEERCGNNVTEVAFTETNTDVVGNVWRYQNRSEAQAPLCGKVFRLKTFYVLACKERQVEEDLTEFNLTNRGSFNTPKEEASNLTNTYILIAFGVGMLLTVLSASTAYGLWRVRKLKKKLDSEDLREFFNGRTDSDDNQLNDYNSVDNALKIPYDQSLEIPKDRLKIDAKKILGTGQFGCVVKAEMKGEDGDMDVAVKMTRSDVSKTAIKGLLSEIKILTYLGTHPNIVSMHGAYTAELEDGIVYLATELCGLGSLESYLRSTQNGAVVDERYSNIVTNINTADLLRWSHEIACGMEYLGTKHVVHADLATRNVLLTLDKTAKITDFGLSRRMYDYQNYVKTHQEPLPWRWMAIESLRRCEFSAQSDVWSYGITLWEIFKMGDTPYPGLSWTMEFVDDLINGLRLSCPPFATPEIYEMMYECWRYDPRTRPTFTLLKFRTGDFMKKATKRHTQYRRCGSNYLSLRIDDINNYENLPAK